MSLWSQVPRKEYLCRASSNSIPFVVSASAILCPHSVIHTTVRMRRYWYHISSFEFHELGKERQNYIKISSLPHNKECITIQMVALNSGIIVLEYDFHKTSVSTIDYGCVNLWRSVHQSIWEINLVNPWNVKLLRKL